MWKQQSIVYVGMLLLTANTHPSIEAFSINIEFMLDICMSRGQ